MIISFWMTGGGVDVGECMNGLVDGWMDVWVEGWMSGGVDGWRVSEWVDEWMSWWEDGSAGCWRHRDGYGLLLDRWWAAHPGPASASASATREAPTSRPGTAPLRSSSVLREWAPEPRAVRSRPQEAQLKSRGRAHEAQVHWKFLPVFSTISARVSVSMQISLLGFKWRVQTGGNLTRMRLSGNFFFGKSRSQNQ